MRPTRIVLAIVVAIAGLVWLGQGVGVIGGSFMTGDPFWAAVGAVLVVLAIGIVATERRRAR